MVRANQEDNLMNMISAQEAIDQGSTPAVFFSIARSAQDKELAREAWERGREIAGMLGMDLGGHKPDNDNRQPMTRRRAREQRGT
jgi:hypothetical protein